MEIEAQVPHGLRPGDTFDVQTPYGLIPVQVPPGSLPGQKVCFAIPHAAHDGGAGRGQPVLLGTVVGAGPPREPTPFGGRIYQAYRIDPKSAQLESLPLLQGIPVQRAERKVDEIRKGGLLALEKPAFPSRRGFQDVFWIAPFVFVVVVVAAAAVYFSHEVKQKYATYEGERKLPAIAGMIVAGAMGGVASLVASLLYTWMTKRAPACVVWTSLLVSPVLLITGGAVLFFLTHTILGLVVILLGVLSLTCVLFCYRPFIPFMIQLVKTVETVSSDHPMMVFVPCLGSIVGLAWSLVCGLAFTGAYLKYQHDLANTSKGEQYFLYFAAVLIFIWGAQVISNICHVTYCGVFGRWYHQAEQSCALRRSLVVALITSLGSICFGSLLVAAMRAMEMLIRQARVDAQEDGNTCCCIMLLVLECVVACVGDILEYFSEWAYVQCAVRDVSFIDASRITYSFMTCSSLELILQDLLVNSVVSFGALLCGTLGCAAGAGAGFAIGAGTGHVIAGAVIGLWSGLVSGSAAAAIISSGTKSILVLWAEDPEPLCRNFPEIHQEFENKISTKLAQF